MRFFRIAFPLDSAVATDQGAILAEVQERLPSFFRAVDPQRESKMHRTETLDLATSSRAPSTSSSRVELYGWRPATSVVQQGTWHSWSNRPAEPCVMVVAMVRRATGSRV